MKKPIQNTYYKNVLMEFADVDGIINFLIRVDAENFEKHGVKATKKDIAEALSKKIREAINEM